MWNVVHIRANQEAQVARFLQQQGVEVYAPKFAPARRTRPGSVRDLRHRRVFPGYLFLRVPPHFARWDAIHWAPGVHRVLSADGAPSMLADSLIDRLRARLSEVSSATRQPFRHGQAVVIEHGPLSMVDAVFDKALNTSERVQVLVHLLGRPTAVAVDAAVLRAAG